MGSLEVWGGYSRLQHHLHQQVELQQAAASPPSAGGATAGRSITSSSRWSYSRLQLPNGFLFLLVLCLLGLRLMTSRPLLELWLERGPLVVLKTPGGGWGERGTQSRHTASQQDHREAIRLAEGDDGTLPILLLVV